MFVYSRLILEKESMQWQVKIPCLDCEGLSCAERDRFPSLKEIHFYKFKYLTEKVTYHSDEGDVTWIKGQAQM